MIGDNVSSSSNRMTADIPKWYLHMVTEVITTKLLYI